MPKYGVHSIILEEAAAIAPAEINALLTAHRGAALLGSVGPDLLFFSPEYKGFDFIMQVAKNLQSIKMVFGKIKEAIGYALGPIEEAIENSPIPIDETIDTVEKVLPVECLSDLVGEVKQSVSTFASSLSNTLLVGIDGGIDLIAEAADLPSFSHRIFDDLFTPESQHGKREWDWYWFDMLHYRNSGLFAKNLLRSAETERQRAYALGYLSHVAADVVGHAYLNRIVCGPYRMHPQRHVVIENFIDSFKYHAHKGVSVNAALSRDLLDAMVADDVCRVDEYSGKVLSFSTELRDQLDAAFKATYPELPTTAGDSKPPRPGWLSKTGITETFENFHVTMSYMRDAYVPKPEGLDERYQDVADALNEILSNFEAPPSPPAIGNTEFCLRWECVEHFLEHAADWISYFAELAKWTFDTLVNALDLLLEILCQATVAIVRAFFYLVEYLSYMLYQEMHFVLALNGYVCPEPSHASDDARGRAMLGTGRTAGLIAKLGALTRYPPPLIPTYPRRHDHDTVAVKPPDSAVEEPPTPFPRVQADDAPDYYIHQAPWTDLPQTLAKYALAATPAETQQLANPNDPQAPQLGNAVELAAWMMEQGLAAVQQEQSSGTPAPLSPLVFCNWDLDADRGYAYKQWFTTQNPSASGTLDEKYLDETLSRD